MYMFVDTDTDTNVDVCRYRYGNSYAYRYRYRYRYTPASFDFFFLLNFNASPPSLHEPIPCTKTGISGNNQLLVCYQGSTTFMRSRTRTRMGRRWRWRWWWRRKISLLDLTPLRFMYTAHVHVFFLSRKIGTPVTVADYVSRS